MLQTIRDRATGWIAYIIIGLLIIPFALWGINQYFSGSGELDAAKVGNISITLLEFQRAYQQQRQRLQSLLGDKIDPAVLEGSRLKQEVLQGLINERLLSRVANQLGLRVGDQQLNQAIQSFEAFQQSGVFNRELYDRLLRSQGYSKAAFEASLRGSLEIDQLREGITSSAIVTPAAMDRDIGLLSQQRELEYVLLPLASYLTKVPVDESAIETYYRDNKDRLLNPEQIQVGYLELEMDKMAEDIPVSEDDLQAAYKEQIIKYTQPEQRSASHILVTVGKEASAEEMDKARARARAIYNNITSGNNTFQQLLQEVEAPGNKVPIGGIKVVTENGWFAVRPSGTEKVYKTYTESFKGREHLMQIQAEAKAMIRAAFRSAGV